MNLPRRFRHIVAVRCGQVSCVYSWSRPAPFHASAWAVSGFSREVVSSLTDFQTSLPTYL
jgi:hypothetical protein